MGITWSKSASLAMPPFVAARQTNSKTGQHVDLCGAHISSCLQVKMWHRIRTQISSGRSAGGELPRKARRSETRARYTEESDAAPEVTVVMPCLNEADTLESCIQKAKQAFWENKIVGEIIVADNGSTDTSPNI